MEDKEKIEGHRRKMDQMRKTLKAAPIIKKFTLPIEAKLEKTRERKKSATLLEPFLDKNLADSESEAESESNDKQAFENVYDIGQKIGEGAHGVVRKCYKKQTKELFAVKTCMLDPEHVLFLKQNFIDIKKLKHPHVLSYKAIFFQVPHGKYHLVMDYLPYPDLLNLTLKTEQEIKELVFQVVETLVYIHSHKICHRDIKPENILYDEEKKRIILVDFGISKKLITRGIKREMLTLTGTPYYRAPQMFEGGGYDELVDMWALGITVYKLLAGVTPFQSEYHSDTINNIMRGSFVFPPKVQARFSRQARLFVSRLLRPKSERITAKEALMDLWFIDIEKKNEDFIRSMTMNRKKPIHSNAKLQVSVFGPVLQRNNTSIENAPAVPNLGKKQMLKIWEGVEQEESMIYGIAEESPPKSGGII